MEDPDELIPCPFEPVHMLQRKRMPYHIIKCRKNQPQKHFRVCPFNHRHIIHRNELAAHLQMCPDQGIVEREITHRHNVSAGLSVIQKGYTDVPVSSFVPPNPSEDWDTSNTVVMVGEYNTQSSDSDMDVTQESRQTTHEHCNDGGVVRRVPEPRLPMNSGPMSEMIQLAGAVAQPTNNISPPRARGRGRGHEFAVSSEAVDPPLVGGLSLHVRNPLDDAPRHVVTESPRGRGRGRFVSLRAEELEAEERGKSLMRLDQEKAQQEKEEEDTLVKKKRERKLKKMLRQIQDLEEKVAQGEELDSDQLAKVGRKDDVLYELALSQQLL